MEQKQDICPHCGGMETVIGKTSGYGRIIPQHALTILHAQNVYHIICLNCGTVIRSYVEHPKDLL